MKKYAGEDKEMLEEPLGWLRTMLLKMFFKHLGHSFETLGEFNHFSPHSSLVQLTRWLPKQNHNTTSPSSRERGRILTFTSGNDDKDLQHRGGRGFEGA